MRKGLILILLFVFLGGVFLHAQESSDWYIGKEMVDIQVKGLKTLAEIEIRTLLENYMGQKMTQEMVWDIYSKLWALEFFESITPVAQPGDPQKQTVILEIQVVEKPRIGSIIYQGNDKVAKYELSNAVLLEKGKMMNTGGLRRDKQAIKDLYTNKGFLDTEVTAEVTEMDDNNRVRITYTVIEGSRLKVSSVKFAGNTNLTEKELKKVMKTKAKGIFQKGAYIEAMFKMDQAAIISFFKEKGYIDAKIVNIDKELVPTEDEGTSNMNITITVSEGEQFTYGGMTFEGNKILKDEALKELIYQKKGQIYNDSSFQSDYQRVVDAYLENGYMYNHFDVKTIKDEPNKVISYVVTIQETERAHIENIIIEGNYRTYKHVILRALPFEEGDVFSKKKIMQGTMALYNTQYFSSVIPKPVQGSSPGLMDLIINVEEQSTSDVEFQMSFLGEPDSPISGKIKWSDKNFLGRGYTFGIEGGGSATEQTASVNFYEPWFMGIPLGLGFDVSYSHLLEKKVAQDLDGNGVPDPYNSWAEYEAASYIPTDYKMPYDSHYFSLGGTVGYMFSTPVGRVSTSTGLRAGWEYIEYDSDLFQPYSDSIRDNLESWLYRDSWTSKVKWDTRDYISDPSKGFLFTESLTFAGIIPDSRDHYGKTVTRLDAYAKAFDIRAGELFHFKMVFKFHTGFLYLFDKPYQENPADPDVNGFATNPMFIARGWDSDSGKKAMWDNSITMGLSIIPNIVAMDLFVDMVGCWATDEALSTGTIEDFKFSIGGGLRLDNKMFPLAFYLVKKFEFSENGEIEWNPESSSTEFSDIGLDFVLSFSVDPYDYY